MADSNDQKPPKEDSSSGPGNSNRNNSEARRKRNYYRNRHRSRSRSSMSSDTKRSDRSLNESNKQIGDQTEESESNKGGYEKLGARPKTRNSEDRSENNVKVKSAEYVNSKLRSVNTSKNKTVDMKNNSQKKNEPVPTIKNTNMVSNSDRKTSADIRNKDISHNAHDTTKKTTRGKSKSKKLFGNGNSKKKNNAKVTDLYIVLDENLSNVSNLKGFLKHRMGNPKLIDFDIVDMPLEKTQQTKRSVITIRFESYQKSSAARNLLNVSNRDTSSKVHCYYDRNEAEGKQNDSINNNENKLTRALNEIVEKVSEMLTKHKLKIQNASEQLNIIRAQLGRKRGVSLDEFEKLSYEKDAYTDKLLELENQKKEFLNYVSSMHDKLNEIKNHKKFDTELKDVRKYFGVECQRLVTALPIYARREDILTTITNNQVSVILGETGSGKSTQIVQYVYEAGFAANGLIACTQPRKIAAISLATKVSSELASSVGQTVGYKVGMQSKTTAITKVVYMTDHILLNECLADRDLKKYSCIVIDEAHERNIHTDLLLGMLKQCLERRPELHVVITSATIDPQLFVDYFDGLCPVLKVSGRTFPVDVEWNQDDYYDSPFPEDYEEKALRKAIELHMSVPVDAGDILVFLTAAAETERAVERFKRSVGEVNVQCLQMHGRLKAEEQQLVLAPTPHGKRKVVFATNNAETSLTIPGVTFVIDTGVVKEMVFDPQKNINSLNVVRISQSSANQRKGRAGRTKPGLCYRLYTEKDFNNMNKITTPEILRVRVSQAILKLMDFGIDPMEFEYVQAPSVESMKSALDDLTQLGAVFDNRLTELGEWISKVPLEPRLGAFVKKGIDENVLSEVLVVASCCSQNGLFFRVGSQEEKKMADMKKVRFCHFGGDLLTMLNVYREWDQTNEKKKSRWCVDNCINGKSVKSVREMVNEIIFVLRKEYSMQIKHSFGDPQSVDSKVQRLVFECFCNNLGYFLGHEKAGYMISDRMQKVQLHPSSSLHSLGLNPTWIVFNKVLRTSDDFLTDVTPVPDECVLQALEDGRLHVDIQFLERQKVRSALKVAVGKHVFWKFVGSMHTNRRKIEDDISRSCDNSMVVIEASKQKGEITLFTVPQYEHMATALLQSILDEMPAQLLLEAREEMIGNSRSGVRAVIRTGGSVSDVLMPNEFRSLLIRPKDRRSVIVEDELRFILEIYGPLADLWIANGKKQQNQCWGKVTFTHSVDAEAAFEYINEDEDSEIYTEPVRYEHLRSSNQRKQEFTMKVTWCRRRAKGHCFVHLACPEDLGLLASKVFYINGSDVDIRIARNGVDLYLVGFGPETMEEDVKKGLLDLLGLSENRFTDRFGVVIPRHNVGWSQNLKLQYEDELSSLIQQYTNIPTDKYRVHVRDFKPKTVTCIAFVTFDDAKLFQKTGECLIEEDASIGGSNIHVSLECKTSVHVDRDLYPMVKKDLDDLIKTQSRFSSDIEQKPLKSGAVVLNINAKSAKHLAKLKVHIDRIVGGDCLEFENTENLHALFCVSGRQLAKRIEHTTKTLVKLDERNMKVTIQGLRKGRQEALAMIREFISNFDTSVEKTARLKGEDLPAGLLKSLLVKYGVSFENLLEETGVTRIQLNLRQHEISITGADEAVSKALKIIEDIKNDMSTDAIVECDAPDCPICLCPVEEHDLSRLEYCGHAYCDICLISMIQNAVLHKELPLVCAKEGCGQPLVIRDFNTMIKIGKIKPAALLDAVLSCFIAGNKDKYRYCITPDCGMVYQVSQSSNGEQFVCPTCRVKICTSCHLPYHDGITCAMYEIAKKDGDSVVKWLSEDKKNRKLCPKCHARIEKNGGCEHVNCTACKAHICWICLKYFETSGECYGHMREGHGTFVI